MFLPEIAKQQAITRMRTHWLTNKTANAEGGSYPGQSTGGSQGHQMKLEAEAEGKKKSLLAEAERLEAMVKAAERNPEIFCFGQQGLLSSFRFCLQLHLDGLGFRLCFVL